MQARLILVTATAAFCAIGGAFITRSLQHSPVVAINFSKSLNQWCLVEGNARGYIMISPGESMKPVSPPHFELLGSGANNTATLTLLPCKNNLDADTCSKSTDLGNETARVVIQMDKPTQIRNKSGEIIAMAYIKPFTQNEEENQQRSEGLIKLMNTYLMEVYKNSTCFVKFHSVVSLDPRVSNPYLRSPKIHGVSRSAGLISWAGDTNVPGRDQLRPLESGGYAWKVIGDATVTMKLLTDPKHPRSMQTFKTGVVPTEPFLSAVYPELRASFPAPGSAPKIYWSQSVPASASSQKGFVKLGNYWIDENGGWQTVARSGEFTGYGKHIINGPDGKPLLILEVAPL
ncbi:hypothetical protein [Armatimonas sp.]|uniref:hypothetical protein n=1 Tax=Armatimonas sp. TaxID=1872638 RepID=UPI0037516BF6